MAAKLVIIKEIEIEFLQVAQLILDIIHRESIITFKVLAKKVPAEIETLEKTIRQLQLGGLINVEVIGSDKHLDLTEDGEKWFSKKMIIELD